LIVNNDTILNNGPENNEIVPLSGANDLSNICSSNERNWQLRQNINLSFSENIPAFVINSIGLMMRIVVAQNKYYW